MPQQQGPKIREEDTTVKGRKYRRWVVDFGTVDGKRKRGYYKTEAKAQRAVRDWETRQSIESDKQKILSKQIGEKAGNLSTDHLLDAAKAFDVLAGAATLEESALFFIRHNSPGGGDKTGLDLYEAYKKDREDAHRRPDTIRDIVCFLKPFGDSFADTQVRHLTTDDLDEWMTQQNGKPQTRNKRRRHLVGMLNFAVKRRYRLDNPAIPLTIANEKKTKAYAVPVDDVGKVMRYAAANEPDMVPFFALGFFAGIRPQGEMSRLDWKDIDFKRREIFLADDVSKTGDERYVEMSANLIAWLLPHRRQVGPVFFSRGKYEAVRKGTGIRWESDCMRHSFGSYHLAMHDDASKTALQMGHRGMQMLFQHYRRAVRKEDATRFWNVAPDNAGNVIQFAAAS